MQLNVILPIIYKDNVAVFITKWSLVHVQFFILYFIILFKILQLAIMVIQTN